MTKEEIEKEYYEWAIRGDFQNETDLIDIDNVWDYISDKITQSLAEAQKTIEGLREELAESEKIREIQKNKLLFKDACELPCKDAEYEELNIKLTTSNKKISELEKEVEKQSELIKHLQEQAFNNSVELDRYRLVTVQSLSARVSELEDFLKNLKDSINQEEVLESIETILTPPQGDKK